MWVCRQPDASLQSARSERLLLLALPAYLLAITALLLAIWRRRPG